MRATILEDVKKLVTKEIPVPVADGKRPIVKVDSVGLCGSDLHFWEVGDPIGLIMGHEFAGTVEDAGERKDLKVGDRVTCLSTAPCLECEDCKTGFSYKCAFKGKPMGIMNAENIGAYTEYFMPEKSKYLYKIPDSISFEEAAMTEPVSITKRAVDISGIKKGDRVVVAGGGIIGAMTAQWCKILGASYVGLTETNAKRAELVAKMGYIDNWYDAKEEGIGEKILKDANAPKGLDIFFDCTGNQHAINFGISVLKVEGVEVWVGTTFSPVPINHLAAIFRQVIIKCTIGYDVHTFEESLQSIIDGRFPVKQYYTSSVDFDGMQKAFETLYSPNNDQFKIMLHPHAK